MVNYASIVPLIGGPTIAMQNVLGGLRPEYILSYDGFQANDKHLLEYYNNEVVTYMEKFISENMTEFMTEYDVTNENGKFNFTKK